MSTTKQVKVDNWGVFFLQRLKHFFNRTDYCDLTLQFQDYAQLKVHRLVLNACTEYFDLLERTCEMYDDCLIMPDDLQVDVVVPIVNFMYTGQLEYEFGLYDRLYSTAQIMNMTVLTKLLDAQKGEAAPAKASKKEIIVMNEHLSDKKTYPKLTSSDISNFSKKRMINRRQYGPGPGLKVEAPSTMKPTVRQTTKPKFDSPRPTRYEVPEELENEDIFESSFADISYESRPLMRPTRNQDSQESMRNIYDEASCSRKFEELQRGTSYKRPRSSSSDTPEGKHIDLDQVNEFAYQQKLRAEYTAQDEQSEDEIFDSLNVEYEKDSSSAHQGRDDSSFLFSQISDASSQSKVSKTTAGKESRATFNHAKIISEVLKKYPHLVKNNKNIKLKIMSGSNKPQLSPKNTPRSFSSNPQKKFLGNSGGKISHDDDDLKPDWTYVSKNMNSEAMAKLVSLGAANTSGPWLCLMCGTPGKALNFSTYQNYYQHLVGVHKEKISANICEYCGYKSGKRNHLLHHLYTKHNVPPPSTHSFPKCNQCSYIALTEAFLIKHKLSHLDNREFSCNVCNALFRTRSQMLFHIQVSGHKISPDRKASNQCVYCNKIFLRETNLYTHLKLAHKEIARKDGIIDNSDEEELYEDEGKFADNSINNKYSQEEHVNIKEEYDGKIQIVSNVLNKPGKSTQKLLNTQLINKSAIEQVRKAYTPLKKAANRDESSNVIQMMEQSSEAESLGNVATGIAASLGLVDRFVVLNDNEYILQSEQGETIGQTIGHVQVGLDENQEIILSDLPGDEFSTQSTLEMSMPQHTSTSQIMTGRTVKTSQKVQPVRNYITSQNQPIQIVVSGNQQFKAIVSTAPVIYTTSNESKTTISPTYIQPPAETVQLQTTSEGTVMVLQDQDFNMTCAQAMPSDGSNIVVVYSHPLEADSKEYVQVDQNQFANLNEGREIDSQIEQMEGDRTESEGILSEQGLVHETVETWQEDSIENLHVEEKHVHVQDNHEDVTCSGDMIIHQEIPLTEDDKVTSTEECDVSEEMRAENVQILTDNSQVIDSEPNEVVISSQETENQISSEHDIMENPNVSEEDIPDPNIDGVPSSGDQESANAESLQLNPTQQNEEDIIQEDVIVMDADEAMDVVDVEEASIITNEISVEAVQAVSSIEHVEKITSEWSDDDTSLKKDSSQELENSNTVNEESLQDNQPMEVEESIENIEKEVQKHMQEKERDGEIQCSPDAQITEETQNCNETPEEVINSNEDMQNNESPILQEEHLEDNDHGVENVTVEKVPIVTSTLKQKTVEKISTLLNDWEDNDSQPEAMEVDGKKCTSTVQKDPHIDKLVSDWDDDDDK